MTETSETSQVLTRIGRGETGCAGADDSRRVQASSAPAVTKTRAVQTIDSSVLDARISQAIVAVAEQCDVGALSALGEGSIAVTQPKRREPLQRALSEITILVTPIVTHPSRDSTADAERAEAIANSTFSTTREAQAILDLAFARVEAHVSQPRFWQIHDALRDRVSRNGGTLDMNWTGPRDQSPMIEIGQPAITINMPQQQPPVVNVAPTVTPTPVTVNVPQAEDKRVLFARNSDGEIIEAITEAA